MNDPTAASGPIDPREHASAPLRLLLVDDDQLVRAGIAGIVSMAPDIGKPAEASDGLEAIEYIRAHRVDIVLLDIQMPRLNGIRTLERMRREHPNIPIAMLTTFSDESFVSEAIDLGALGFFLKSDDPQNLIAGVRALASGGAAFSPRVGRWLIRREAGARLARSTRAREAVRALSSRQRDLLAEIGQGRSNAQIATSLRLSEGTVKQYLSTLFSTLHVDNRVQAALIAYEARLTHLDERESSSGP